MNYPDCPEDRDDCRFVNEGGMSTCMYSPIVYDRQGNPVDGGGNANQFSVSCRKCGKRWYATQTDLERAQGKTPDWSEPQTSQRFEFVKNFPTNS